MARSQVEPLGQTRTGRDVTFQHYKLEAAAEYAAYRGNYPPKFIQTIIDQHTSSGGELNSLLDIGCGPGTATVQLAPYFQNAIGADPGQSMIEVARSVPCTTASGSAVRYEVCGAEDIARLAEPGTVDLITAGTCAHWFDLPAFYTAAATVLKPGGSIAIFCGGNMFCIPETTPNHVKIQELWDHFQQVTLLPFDLPGNHLCRDFYIRLPLPWTLPVPNPSFSPSLSQRHEFNADRLPRLDDPDLVATKGYLRMRKAPLDVIAKMVGTVSPVTRWREAHREAVERGEIRDCVEEVLEVCRRLMKEGGAEEGRDWVEVAGGLVLILIKKT